MINTLQLSMSIATMGEEIMGVSVRLNQSMRAISKTSSFIRNFEFPDAWVATYFMTGSSFVGLMLLLTGIGEGKILLLARSI